jgi:hypothetical protein
MSWQWKNQHATSIFRNKKSITMHINKKIQVSCDVMVYHSTLDANIQHKTN